MLETPRRRWNQWAFKILRLKWDHSRIKMPRKFPLPHMTVNVMEGTEAISMQECVVQEAWCGWWESLKMAHRMLQVMAALQDKLRGEPMVCVKKLMQEEAENFEIWRTCFLEEGNSFEENGMEVNAFRMCDWVD